MKNYIYIILFLLCSIPLFSQREMIVTEMNSDNDAVIDIVGEDPSASDYMLLTLGFNQSNHGWLRTKTDHDLSFWTFNKKRFTIKNTGDIGVGTSIPLEKLFILNGNLGLETNTSGLFDDIESSGINFYTGSTVKSRITYCDCPADAGDLLSFNLPDNGLFNFKAGSQNHLIINRDGSIEINDLEGSGQRTVYAEADGTLKTSDVMQYKVVSPTHFLDRGTSAGDIIYGDEYFYSDIFIASSPVSAIAHPDIPYTKYEIVEIEMIYVDNIDNISLDFIYNGPNEEEVSSRSFGANDEKRSTLLSINQIINQELGESFSLVVAFGTHGEEKLSFHHAIVKYKPIF